jgi:hypothetical protein
MKGKNAGTGESKTLQHMARIIVTHKKNDDGSVNSIIKYPPLDGRKLSEMVASEIEYRIKALPVSDAYKEELRILIGSYGILKATGD